MLIAVLLLFALALAAPLIDRAAGRWTGAVLALGPLAAFLIIARWLPDVAAGETITQVHAWADALDIRLSFYLDGLSLMFALLISGIGTLIVFYAGTYLEGDPRRGRFYAWLLIFMASMLGLVLADNIISMFIFWELTSVSSYFLIGYDHHRESARKSALQAMLVTGGGGLALLAGLIMLGVAAGSMEVSQIINEGEVLREHAWYLPIVILVFAGCFTKSAQFPFHFWLPNAMEAPTPVSAYLHSSTMVKAGVYLLARLNPALGATDVWLYTLVIFGGVTMLVGAYLAIRQVYLKKILAYSTVSALGVLVFLTGLSNVDSPEAAQYAGKAFAVFLLAHALYKATLFLVAGTITHETGEKDVTKLGGLRRKMPLTALAAALAGASMAGLPPFFGFLGKELLLDTTVKNPDWMLPLTIAAGVAGFLFVIVALLIAVKPFWGALKETAQHPHEAPFAMWFGPALLGSLSLLFGLFLNPLARPIIEPTASAVMGVPQEVKLALWHGINLPLMISVAAVVLGILAFLGLPIISRILKPFDALNRIGPERGYYALFNGTLKLASFQTRLLQSGYLRVYLFITITMSVGLIGWQILQLDVLPIVDQFREIEVVPFVIENLYTLIVAALILIGTFGAVHSRSRLSAIASLGVVGYGVALIYIIHGAPDLAITQFLIETLTVILFVLVFYHLPQFPRISSVPARVRDLVVSVAAGVMMTVLVLIATNLETEKISDYFAENSYELGQGRNIVNVILVDFRSMDTLGEIVVLVIAAVGVLALLKLKPPREQERKNNPHEADGREEAS
ncbi:MAG: putative monovalent cation/H+ antiporter subunit A [Phycisphaerales bacterium]|nr:MAG: putative monovalent cation/H+ antiporter subunit A [Phycisphaerales bacterium]